MSYNVVDDEKRLESQHRQEVMHYMMENVYDHVDRMTDEVNATTLAEDACSHYGMYVELTCEIPQFFFDCAERVAAKIEKSLRIRREEMSK